jgi:diguanylate cyclase (GGDEF)-like protein
MLVRPRLFAPALKWVRERGTRDKLLGTVGGLCLVTALVGYLGLRTAQDMMTSLNYFEQVLVPSNVAAVSAREGLRNARQQAALAADPETMASDLPRLHSQFNRYVGDSRRALAAYEDLPLSDGERALLPDYAAAELAYLAATEPVWLVTAGSRELTLTRYQTRAEPQAARMERVISDLVVLQGQRSSDEAAAAQLAYASALNLLLAAIIGGTLGALVLGIFVARCIASPREEAALAHRALHDTLTGLPNRALLNDRLAEAVQVARRTAQSFSLLLVDLDHFKDVNDTLGHHAGDLLLKELGRRLQASVRSGDTVARLGGDEFAILLPGTTGATASGVAAAAIGLLQRPVMLEGQEVAVGASVGIAIYPEHGEDIELLIRRADVAMYRAKQQRGNYAIYEIDQDHESSDRLALVTAASADFERDSRAAA